MKPWKAEQLKTTGEALGFMLARAERINTQLPGGTGCNDRHNGGMPNRPGFTEQGSGFNGNFGG